MTNTQIHHLVKTGTITNKVNTTDTIQTCQISSFQNMEVHNNRPMFAHFGFCSVPPTGSQFIALAGSGLNNNSFVIGTHDINTHPKNLNEGEVKLYDKNNQSLYLSVNGIIIESQNKYEIKLADKVIFEITASGITINSDIVLNGKLTATGDIIAGDISVENHVHGGVQTGTSETSTPK